jgi:Zn-dependent protease
MFKSWRIGRLFGFPVEVNASFLLMLAVVFLWMGGLAGLFVVGLAFGSVLLHELGHSLVARKLGVPVSGIELSFFGGAAKMVDLPKSANDEIAIAAAGPAVSLGLAGLGFGLGAAFASPLLALVGWINLVIAGFNLIPALPMDGGRILRALLTRRMDYATATDVAVRVSRIAAIAFAVIGVAYSAFQLLLLAPLLWVMGPRERMLARAVGHRFGTDRNGYRHHGGFGFHREEPPAPPWAPPASRAPRRMVVDTPQGRYIITLE